jgi:hypothetical protein
MTRLLRKATLLAAFSLLTSGATAHAESVTEMATSCKSVGEAKVSGHGVEFVEDYRAGICWGAFCAVQRVIVQAFVPDPTPLPRLCPGKESTRSQLVAVFVEYARRTPQRLHEDSSMWRSSRSEMPSRASLANVSPTPWTRVG